jgi:RHS repeat-associated protein
LQTTVELIAGLVRGLRIVFAVFAEDMGADVQSTALLFCLVGYLAPWLARWISPDSAGVIAGLNLYVYVGNNPLKYIDPTGHVKKTPEQDVRN